MSRIGTALIAVGAVLVVLGIAGMLLRLRATGPPQSGPAPAEEPGDEQPASAID